MCYNYLGGRQATITACRGVIIMRGCSIIPAQRDVTASVSEAMAEWAAASEPVRL